MICSLVLSPISFPQTLSKISSRVCAHTILRETMREPPALVNQSIQSLLTGEIDQGLLTAYLFAVVVVASDIYCVIRGR